MRQVTATELSRNLRRMLDRVEFEREELVVLRNQHEIARIVPCVTHQTALEAMADLYRSLPEDAAEGWLEDSRSGAAGRLDELEDPWDS